MPRKTHNHQLDVPPLELDCMRMLWALGQGTVHEIRARLLPERPLAYTTVMTVMDHLTRKGMAGREKRGRAFVYRPLVSEQAVRERAIDRLTRNFFLNSRDRLRSYLGGEARADQTRPVNSLEARQEERPGPGIDPSLL
jgi:BlaI family transcriptional regulator, penicillinase repressor